MSHNNYFQFKQFRVEQNHAAMRVGTDGVLLGAWADVENAKTILDVGTGTGVVALMLAQRCNAQIDAIDIEAGAITDTLHNFKQSPWDERLHAQHISLQELAENCTKQYDCIVSNPPFFNHSLQSINNKKAIARHTHKLSFDNLISGVATLLNKGGKFCVILPIDSEKEFVQRAAENGLFGTKITRVKPNINKAFKRVLLQFEFTKRAVEENEIIIETETRHRYTEQFTNLMKPFYLNL